MREFTLAAQAAVRRLGLRPSERAEVLDEVIRGLLLADQREGVNNPRSLALKIAKRRLVDLVRNKNRRPRLSQLQATSTPDPTQQPQRDDESALDHELHRIVASLSAHDLWLVQERIVKGRTLAELAAESATPLSTLHDQSKSLLRRLLSRLRAAAKQSNSIQDELEHMHFNTDEDSGSPSPSK